MKLKNAASIVTSPRELFLTLRIFIFMISIPLMLKYMKIQSLVSCIDPRRSHKLSDRISIERVIYLCNRIQDMLRERGLKYTCLRRSLLLFHFLRYYGQKVVINFGIKWKGNDLTGHSWLTLDGEPYLEPEGKPGKFTFVFSLPDSSGVDSQEQEVFRREIFDS